MRKSLAILLGSNTEKLANVENQLKLSSYKRKLTQTEKIPAQLEGKNF